MAIGDTGRIDESLDLDLTSTGLSHLTAVSGANCAVLVGLVVLVGGALGLRRWLTLLLAGLVLAAFVVLVTPEPSVERAALMAGIALLLRAVGRPTRGLPLLAGAVVLLLVTDPWLARGYAFSLSVLATAGLVVLTAPLTALLARALPDWLALSLAVPLAAQAACQPLLLSLDPAIPVFSVVANLLAEPAAPVATVLGLVACVVAPVWPGGALGVATVAWAPAAWVAAVARFFASVPSGSLAWGSGALAIAAAAAIVVLVAAVALTTPYRRSRRVAVALLLLVVLPLATVTTGREIGRRASLPADWEFAQCDIGQGDAVLVRSSGVTALIDTGDDEMLLADCLRLFGVERLDLLVLTHYDRDHVGASPTLVGRADSLLVGPPDGTADEHLVGRFRSAGSRVLQAAPGLSLRLGRLTATVLWPPAHTTPGNTASVVLDIRGDASCGGACLSGLFLGDLGEQEQQRLVGRGAVAPVDVVKVSHHGSRDQSPALYAAARARLGLIGVGVHNTYGHPTKQTLAMLRRSGTAVIRSDLDGTAAVAAGPGGVPTVWKQGARLSAAAPRLGGGHDTAGARPAEADPGDRSVLVVAGGGTWLRGRRARRQRARRRSTRSRGAASGRPGSCSSPAPSSSSPIVRSGSSATSSPPKTRASR
jgi:competence protein ComEC